MATEVVLTAAQRNSVLRLQNTADLSAQTQNRLSSGRKIESVVDDAISFFRARALNNRADDFAERKDGIDQGISTIRTAIEGADAIDKLLTQMIGIAEASRSQSEEQRKASTRQFKELMTQISELANDSSYQGLNLINATNAKMEVAFGVRTSSRLVVDGFDFNATTVNNDRALFVGTANESGTDDQSINFKQTVTAGSLATREERSVVLAGTETSANTYTFKLSPDGGGTAVTFTASGNSDGTIDTRGKSIVTAFNGTAGKPARDAGYELTYDEGNDKLVFKGPTNGTGFALDSTVALETNSFSADNTVAKEGRRKNSVALGGTDSTSHDYAFSLESGGTTVAFNVTGNTDGDVDTRGNNIVTAFDGAAGKPARDAGYNLIYDATNDKLVFTGPDGGADFTVTPTVTTTAGTANTIGTTTAEDGQKEVKTVVLEGAIGDAQNYTFTVTPDGGTAATFTVSNNSAGNVDTRGAAIVSAFNTGTNAVKTAGFTLAYDNTTNKLSFTGPTNGNGFTLASTADSAATANSFTSKNVEKVAGVVPTVEVKEYEFIQGTVEVGDTFSVFDRDGNAFTYTATAADTNQTNLVKNFVDSFNNATDTATSNLKAKITSIAVDSAFSSRIEVKGKSDGSTIDLFFSGKDKGEGSQTMVRDTTNETTGKAFVPAQNIFEFPAPPYTATETATFKIGTTTGTDRTFTYTVPNPAPTTKAALADAIVKNLNDQITATNTAAENFRNDISAFVVNPANDEQILVKSKTDVGGGQPLKLEVGSTGTNSVLPTAVTGAAANSVAAVQDKRVLVVRSDAELGDIYAFDITLGSGEKQSIAYTATAADDANTVATKLKEAIDANSTLAADVTVTVDDGELKISGPTDGRQISITNLRTNNKTGAVYGESGIPLMSNIAAGFNGAGFTDLTAETASEQAEAMILSLRGARSKLRGFTSQLGSNVAILQTRLQFTKNYINELRAGSDNLTLADLNEEGANLTALQTRQQLGIQALSIAGQQQSAILSLLR